VEPPRRWGTKNNRGWIKGCEVDSGMSEGGRGGYFGSPLGRESRGRERVAISRGRETGMANRNEGLASVVDEQSHTGAMRKLATEMRRWGRQVTDDRGIDPSVPSTSIPKTFP